MDIIDAQVHAFYRLDEHQMIAVMDALGIQGVVIDEFWEHMEDGTAWPFRQFANGAMRWFSPGAQAAALRHPERFSFLQRVSRTDPELVALFAILGSTPGCRAVRIDVRSRAERLAMREGAFDALLGLAERHDLAVCIFIYGRDNAEVLRGAAVRFPDVRFVLDHCGNPKTPEHWADILSLGGCGNVWMKWCHAHHFFEAGSYPFPGLHAELARTVDAFGIERVLWASDITHDEGHSTWADLLYALREGAGMTTEDKEWLLGRSAREAFRWNPPVAARGDDRVGPHHPPQASGDGGE